MFNIWVFGRVILSMRQNRNLIPPGQLWRINYENLRGEILLLICCMHVWIYSNELLQCMKTHRLTVAFLCCIRTWDLQEWLCVWTCLWSASGISVDVAPLAATHLFDIYLWLLHHTRGQSLLVLLFTANISRHVLCRKTSIRHLQPRCVGLGWRWGTVQSDTSQHWHISRRPLILYLQS